MNENSKISTLKGIGDKTQALFEKAGVGTLSELLRYYPRGYDIYDDPVPLGEVEEGRTVTVTGAISGRVQLDGNHSRQVARRCYHPSRKSGQKKGWSGNGAS